MTLAELKKIVDSYCENKYVNPDEVNVIITLEEMSIGPRAGTGVENIFMGFDWEHNQLRIQPKEKLVRYNKQRDIPKRIIYYKTLCRIIDRAFFIVLNYCGVDALTLYIKFYPFAKSRKP